MYLLRQRRPSVDHQFSVEAAGAVQFHEDCDLVSNGHVEFAERRQEIRNLEEKFAVSERRALQVTGWPRSTHRHESRAQDQTALRMRLRELAADRPRYGYRRSTILLRREGWHVNSKRVYRLDSEEGLTVRVKRRKKLASHARVLPVAASRVNGRWSMDFVADSLSDGRKQFLASDHARAHRR